MPQTPTVLQPVSSVPHLNIRRGTCYVLFAFELGLSINLEAAELRIKETKERTRFRRDQKAPKYFDYDPPPLRVSQHGQQINLGHFFTRSEIGVTLFDFGACSVQYEIDLTGPLRGMIELSEVLYDNSYLLKDAQERVHQLMREIGPAISRPRLSDAIEDYTVYHLEEFETPIETGSFWKTFGSEIARVLRAEKDTLSTQEITDALSYKIAYSDSDEAVIDWNAACLLGGSAEDFIAVAGFCNVELLEMRYLDEQLDDYLEQAYHAMLTGKRTGTDLRKIARLQVDSAILFEAVENALKLLGDQYLARVYSLISRRFHLPEWNTSILRKLDTLDSIYNKLADHAAHRRSEMLEWVIILLITFEIVWSLMGNG